MYNFINIDTEDMLYASVIAEDFHNNSGNANNIQYLHCKFFQINLEPSQDDIHAIVEDVLSSEKENVYLCRDGDVIISWPQNEGIRDELIQGVSKKYASDIKKYMSDDEFFVDYSLANQWEVLKEECLIKQKKQSKKTAKLSQYFENEILIKTLKHTTQLISMQRSFRVNPHILIVEDQVFSQKILLSILKDYTCHVTASSGEALLKYMETCPDIVLLDVELPDISGHGFAELVKKIDPSSYVIMVTANSYQEDIDLAKKNNVNGFIVKPYQKDDIIMAIERFKSNKKKKQKKQK